MKIFIFIFLLILSFSIKAGDKKGPEFTYENDRHDYGVIYTDDMPETKLDIKFTNTGDEALILTGVRACCGTRVVYWPQEPVLPGEEGIIKVEFRLAPRPHRISRTVIATSNMEKSNRHIFRIMGELKDAKDRQKKVLEKE